MSAPMRGTSLCLRRIINLRCSFITKEPLHTLCTVVTNDTPAVLKKGSVCQNVIVSSTQIQSIRYTSFFNKTTASQLWESVSSVSNAGKKKGRSRGPGRRKIPDLNRGQFLGDGMAGMQWPGLNAPVIKNRMVVRARQQPEENREQRLINVREAQTRVRYPSTPPLLRGFTGGRLAGMRYGAPDPIGDYQFENFDSVLLELKHVTNMTGTLGRKMHYTAFVVVGNGQGVAGFGLGKGTRLGSAIRIAKNRAGQNLYYVPLFDGHTVYHDMYSEFHKAKIFIHKKERGFGLRCHRAITAICKMIGITDLHCKVERRTSNYKTITKGFLNALAEQETHQALADRTGYHVVEMRPERHNLPILVASPSDGHVKTESWKPGGHDIGVDVNRMYLKDHLEYVKPLPLGLRKLRSYRKSYSINHKRRNQFELHIQRTAGLI